MKSKDSSEGRGQAGKSAGRWVKGWRKESGVAKMGGGI